MRTHFAGFAYCIHKHAQSIMEWRQTGDNYWLEAIKTWAVLARSHLSMM